MARERRLIALYEKARQNPASLTFKEARALAEGAGFRLDRVRGSHHIFHHAKVRELLNLQNVRGQAKPYQVRQLLRLMEEHGLQPQGGGSDAPEA